MDAQLDEHLTTIAYCLGNGGGAADQKGMYFLEGIAAALAGDNLRSPVGPAVEKLASSISELAEAINFLATALKK